MACSATLPGRLGCCLSPGGEHGEGPPYLVHLCGSVSGMAPDWLGFGECRRVRGQSADSWNRWLGRMPPTADGFLPSPHSVPHGAGIWHFPGRGPRTCSWGNSCEEYSVYLLHFLSFPRFGVFVQMYVKMNTKIKDVYKDVATGMFSNRKKMENNLNVHIRE